MAKLPPPPPTPERHALTPDEACVALRISRATLYALMKEGALRYFQIKSRRRIPASEIERMISGAT